MHLFSPHTGRAILLGTTGTGFFILLFVFATASWDTTKTLQLPDLLPQERTILAGVTSDKNEWERIRSLLERFDDIPSLPSRDELPDGLLYEFGLVAPEDFIYEWIVRIEQETGSILLTSAETGTQSLLLLPETPEPSFADLSLWQEYKNTEALYPHALVFSKEAIPQSSMIGENILTSLFDPISFVGIAWNNKNKGMALLQKKESSPPQSGVALALAPMLDNPDLIIESIAPHAVISYISQRIIDIDETIEQGIRGIVLQAWKDAIGDRADIKTDLGPLTAHITNLEVATGSGDATVALLKGKTTQTGSELMAHIMKSLPRAVVRTVPLLRGEVRRDVITKEATEEMFSKKNIKGWNVQTVTFPNEKQIIFAMRLDEYILTNKPALLDSQKIKARSLSFPLPSKYESALSVGEVRIAWLKDTLKKYVPFLMIEEEETTVFPWNVLSNVDRLKWTLSETSDVMKLQWEAKKF